MLAAIVGGLPYPVHFILGNHDDRAAFHRVMRTGAASPDARHHWAFEHAGHRFVGLDSHVPGQAWGELDAAQLTWLDAELRTHAGRPSVVFVHHHPWPLGLAWMDSMPLRNGDALVAVLARHPAVRWIVCGHVHLDQHLQRDGLSMLTTPSTCFQVSKLSQTRKILPGPPGFRLVEVDGAVLSTRVVHLHGEAGAADL
jgi:Icc protein